MCPNWVSCCAPWLDIPAGCSVVLSGPMMGTHCIQPIAFVTECRRFGLMQFSSSSFRSLFWHFAYSATPDRFFLLVANLVFAALRMWRRVGRVWHCSVCAKLSLISTLSLPSFLGSFRLSSCLLRICFESTVGAFLNNLLLFDIWSELSTFWHKFAVVHDEERIVPAFANRDLGFCKSEASLGSN